MTSPKIAKYSLAGLSPLPSISQTSTTHSPPIRAIKHTLTFLPPSLDLKNTTDDALPNYLNSLSFKQNHTLTDVRLALGYAAVSIAAVLFYADWKLGWDKTKDATLAAVVGYFVINTALTGWIWLVEKGVVYKGEREGTVVSSLPFATAS